MTSPTDGPDQEPYVALTDAAVQRLKWLIEQPGPPVAGIRVQIARRTAQGFEHLLTMVDVGQEPEDDEEQEVAGFKLYIEERNAEYLDGATIDYRDKGEGVSGFEFRNPNPVWREPLAMRIQQLFNEQLNPSIAAHGGYVELLSVEDHTAYIALGGGCQGCGMADVTLKQGIEVAIKETVPEIEEILDVTDHAAGANPFFQPEKK